MCVRAFYQQYQPNDNDDDEHYDDDNGGGGLVYMIYHIAVHWILNQAW